MNKLRVLTAGESHGRGMIGVIDGLPSGITISSEKIDKDLHRRQGGYGRGGRMKIESDHAEILTGVRWGKTLGSPITLLIENKDWLNWHEGMSHDSNLNNSIPPVARPRPGHADLAGGIKYSTKDFRNILERSSARETAARVALGSVAKQFLSEFNIVCGSYVIQIGDVKCSKTNTANEKKLIKLHMTAENSPVRCPFKDKTLEMIKYIETGMKNKDTVGGVFVVFVTGVPTGLGSHVQWDRKLDARLSMSLMSIQAIKGVEVGMGFESASLFGSKVMDEIYYDNRHTTTPFFRKSNNAGGIEGGISNGMPIVLTAAMKPIPTLKKPLRSIDINTKKSVKAAYERSDVCAVPAASVVGEAMVALCIADAFLDKFGGDSIEEIKSNYENYEQQLRNY